MTQLSLPMPGVKGESRCGYCLRRLVRQPRGDWRCERCGPILVELGMGMSLDAAVIAFRHFCQEAWASRENA